MSGMTIVTAVVLAACYTKKVITCSHLNCRDGKALTPRKMVSIKAVPNNDIRTRDNLSTSTTVSVASTLASSVLVRWGFKPAGAGSMSCLVSPNMGIGSAADFIFARPVSRMGHGTPSILDNADMSM